MRTRRWSWLLGLALLCPAGAAQAHVIIFKDGFAFAGQVKAPGSFESDPASGIAVWITKGVFILDADARRVFFSPGQVQDVLDKDVYEAADVVRLESRISRAFTAPMYPLTNVIGGGPWDEHWERTFKLVAPHGRVNAEQRLGYLTPFYARVDAKKYNWSSYYLTSELGPAAVRSLLYSHPDTKKSERESPEFRFRVYRFLAQAGWYAQAADELTSLLKDFPGEKEKVEEARGQLKKLRALQLFEDIERAHQAGQFRAVRAELARFPREGVGEKTLAGVRALQATYEANGESLEAARRFLKQLPRHTPQAFRAMYQEAADAILAEVDLGNVVRLEEFVTAAKQAERDKEKGEKPKEPEQIMARAVTGWLLGKDASEDKPEVARRLWQARKLVLDYQKEDDVTERERFLKEYLAFKSDVLPIDVLSQLIATLPPPLAEKDLGRGVLSLRTKLPTGPKNGIPYAIYLPPEYHHGREYPVVIALHHAGEPPGAMLERVAPTAAKYGYIVVAPEWDQGNGGAYAFSSEEHAAVTDVLWDVRRRFQVDSDRVFLMGVGEGGTMAYDVGLSHPDLFAGVLPMAGWSGRHGERYWPNCLNLPLYVVDGSMSGEIAKKNQEMFKKWVALGYPAIYVQYKGRGVEWFAGELPSMFDWMDHKKGAFKRATAYPELARLGSTPSREFQMMRTTDNHMYWLSTNKFLAGHVMDGKWESRITAATVYGRILEGNVINVNERCLRQLTVWLTKDMIDFTKPVTVRVNGAVKWLNRKVTPSLNTLLEDLYQRGDRQRLYWARLDFDLF